MYKSDKVLSTAFPQRALFQLWVIRAGIRYRLRIKILIQQREKNPEQTIREGKGVKPWESYFSTTSPILSVHCNNLSRGLY